MISGLPRNSDSFRDGPDSPSIVASRRVPPISTSPGVFASAGDNVQTTQISSQAKKDFMPGSLPDRNDGVQSR
jgi:hypothetical protein